MEQGTGVASGAIVAGTLGNELMGVLFDLRWMMIFSLVLILADFWWGHSESMKRLAEAREMGSAALIDKYKWHKSRAGRRTLSKLVDYVSYLLVGGLLGMAITEPMGWCNHTITAAVGLGAGCLCELASIIGHVAYVKYGVEIKMRDIWRIIGKVALSIVKKKNETIGEAIEESLSIGETDGHSDTKEGGEV